MRQKLKELILFPIHRLNPKGYRLHKKAMCLASVCFIYFCSGAFTAEYVPYCYPGLPHEKCGTLEDPNYRAAFNAVQNAANFCFPSRSIYGFREEPYLFPRAVNDIRNGSGYPIFHYEGSLSWRAQESGSGGSPEGFLCKRVIGKSSQIDRPIRIFPGEDKPSFCSPAPIFIEEERVIRLYKDYSALLSIFPALKEDLLFVRENNRSFLQRRMPFVEDYCKSGSSYMPMRKSDLEERLRYYEKQYEIDCSRVEKYHQAAIFYCKSSLDFCIAQHQNPFAHVNRGLLDYLEGNVLDALDHINQAFKKTGKSELDALKDNALLLKGRSELEAGLYADAILTLSELIDKHPDHKDAYFERATAYFELGNFDLSLADYLTAELKLEPPANEMEIVAFTLGMTKGIVEGGVQAGVEFVPSLLSSFQGIGHGLWAFALDPVHVSQAFIEASQECIHFIRNHTAQDTLLELAPELKELIEKWDTLKDEKKGELTGFIIGKYGVDIFAGVGCVKIMKSYRALKRANNLLTFEAMAISKRNKAIIELVAVEKAQIRKEILSHGNLTIQADKQGKHLPGHRNFLDKKSILEHPNPQQLVKDFAGKGMKSTELPPGVSGYQEVVNFGEFIGYAINRDTGEKIATNWGKIHYAKDGVHIVPKKPG